MIYHTRALPSCGASITLGAVKDRLSMLVAHANKIGQKVVVTGCYYSVTKDNTPRDRYNLIIHVTNTADMDIGLFGVDAMDYASVRGHLDGLCDVSWKVLPDQVLDTTTVIQEDQTPPVVEGYGNGTMPKAKKKVSAA